MFYRGRQIMRDQLGTYLPRVIMPLLRSEHVFYQLPRDASAPFGNLPQTRVAPKTPALVGQKRLTLTFDDGPHPVSTPMLLEILDRYQIKATFFLIGANALLYPELVREIEQRGHAVGNHSYSHPYAWKISTLELIRDFHKGLDALSRIVTRPIRWQRPPYGNLTNKMVVWGVRHGIETLLWDLVISDYKPTTDYDLLKRFYMSRLRDRSIVCLHDNEVSQHYTPRLLTETIPVRLEDNWQFESLAA